MNQQLFRQSSIDRVFSPEQLNDYIRVTNPGVWMVLEDGQQVDPSAPVVIDGRKFSLGPAVGGGAYPVSVDLPGGEYQAQVVTESVTPMSFVFN